MRISFDTQCDFLPDNTNALQKWLVRVAQEKGKIINGVDFIFCTDAYLLDINKRFLNHDYFTDIISFDYSDSNALIGEIYISVDRVRENAATYNIDFNVELYRVIVHGILHFCGLKDGTDDEKQHMRNEEDKALSLLSF